MIYIKYDSDNQVTLKHNMPFDAKSGLGKTEAELLQDGILVESIPVKPIKIAGKFLRLYVNPIRWEYIDKPLTQGEVIEQMVEDGTLTEEQAELLLAN